MTAESGPLRGGELNAAITSAVVGIHNAHLGRGPKTATTFHKDNMVVTVLREVMTHAEKTLARNENEDAVSHMRHLFQKTMQADYTNAIERLTGRKVIAFVSGNNTNPDIASELFILDGNLYPTTRQPGRITTDGEDS
jgi:uncharacterized protein YbcI